MALRHRCRLNSRELGASGRTRIDYLRDMKPVQYPLLLRWQIWQGRCDSNARVRFWRPTVWPLSLLPCMSTNKNPRPKPRVLEFKSDCRLGLQTLAHDSPNDPLPGHSRAHGFGPYLHRKKRTPKSNFLQAKNGMSKSGSSGGSPDRIRST